MTDLPLAVLEHRKLVATLREFYPDADDQTLADTAEGLGTLDLAIAAVLREAVESEAMASGLGDLLKKLQERKRRLETRADRLRVIALRAAEEAGIKSLRTPDMTVAVMHGKRAVVITDEVLLPDWAVETKRIPKKGEIGDALRTGDDVPGATLGNASSYWMIRRG